MKNLITFVMICNIHFSFSAETKNTVKAELKNLTESVDITKDIVTNQTLNIFFQKKLSNYFSGTEGLSFYQGYVTYSNENDKLTIGYNITSPYVNKTDNRNKQIKWIFNPYIQLGIKQNFASIILKMINGRII